MDCCCCKTALMRFPWQWHVVSPAGPIDRLNSIASCAPALLIKCSATAATYVIRNNGSVASFVIGTVFTNERGVVWTFRVAGEIPVAKLNQPTAAIIRLCWISRYYILLQVLLKQTSNDLSWPTSSSLLTSQRWNFK